MVQSRQDRVVPRWVRGARTWRSCSRRLLLIIPLFGVCLDSWAKDPPASAAPTTVSPAYLIQPGDILEIFVWKEPELSRKVLVRPDGFISFPLVQDLRAADTAPAELKTRIEEKLKDFVSAPNVTVVVDTIKSYTVFVVGNSRSPSFNR